MRDGRVSQSYNNKILVLRKEDRRMSTAEAAAEPPVNGMEAQIDAIFDKADDLMINQKNHAEAVSTTNPNPITRRLP